MMPSRTDHETRSRRTAARPGSLRPQLVARDAAPPATRATTPGAPVIAQVSASYPPRLGGLENVTRVLATRLAEDADVIVLTTAAGACDAPARERHGRLRVSRSRAAVVAHTPISPGLAWRLLTLPRRTVVHVHTAGAWLPEVVWLTCALRRRRYVAHFHMDVEPSGRCGFLLGSYQRWILGPVLRRATRVLVLTTEQAAQVADRYGVHPAVIVVLPNGVGTDVDRPAQPRTAARRHAAAPLRLLFVGRLDPQKNLTRLLDAVELTESPLEVVLVGDGEQRDQLSHRVARGTRHPVRLVGAQYGADLRAWYAWADALVSTSDREGMPLVLLEAMVAGLPIVATDVAGTRDVVGEAGLLAAPTPVDVAAALDRLALDDDRYARLAAASHARGARYAWDDQVDLLRRLYREVAAS